MINGALSMPMSDEEKRRKKKESTASIKQGNSNTESDLPNNATGIVSEMPPQENKNWVTSALGTVNSAVNDATGALSNIVQVDVEPEGAVSTTNSDGTDMTKDEIMEAKRQQRLRELKETDSNIKSIRNKNMSAMNQGKSNSRAGDASEFRGRLSGKWNY